MEAGKKAVIGRWESAYGAMPLMFHEKIRSDVGLLTWG